MTVWRVGRHVGRTIYVQDGPEPSDDDRLIGVMDTRELAESVVEAVNVVRAVGELPPDVTLQVVESVHERPVRAGPVTGRTGRHVGRTTTNGAGREGSHG